MTQRFFLVFVLSKLAASVGGLLTFKRVQWRSPSRCQFSLRHGLEAPLRQDCGMIWMILLNFLQFSAGSGWWHRLFVEILRLVRILSSLWRCSCEPKSLWNAGISKVLITRRIPVVYIRWANCRWVDSWLSWRLRVSRGTLAIRQTTWQATLHSADPGEGLLKFVLCLVDIFREMLWWIFTSSVPFEEFLRNRNFRDTRQTNCTVLSILEVWWPSIFISRWLSCLGLWLRVREVPDWWNLPQKKSLNIVTLKEAKLVFFWQVKGCSSMGRWASAANSA